jgi:hypothetical protein
MSSRLRLVASTTHRDRLWREDLLRLVRTSYACEGEGMEIV